MKTWHRGRGDGNTLVQVMAAVVAAAAHEVSKTPCCPDHEPAGLEVIQCCFSCPDGDEAGSSDEGTGLA
jgi:hypothetical protein